MHRDDLTDIKTNLNHNFVRTCHYTQDKYVYDLCDSLGIIVCEEVPNIKNQAFSEDVQEQQLREMIRRDRNHPSILFWSLGNETTNATDSKWAVEEDTTRFIHARHIYNNSAGDYVDHTDEDMDMENLLRCTVRGWYNKDVKPLEPQNNQETGTEEFQHRMARIMGASQRGRIDMGNGVMWLYADHGADREYKYSPLKHVNPKGWVDAYRIPKYMYFLWQANYCKTPMVFIHPHFWRKPYLGTVRDLTVDSNCDSVILKINNTYKGTLYPTKDNFHTVTFNSIVIEQGTAEAIGYKKGTTISSKITMADTASNLVLSSNFLKANAAGNL
ncbi:MAG: glycoside hydrolase family 2 protein [Bacteroidales bacterium]|nr:glycoside hydrolase family 2 protein [Bacteroidales bacterium]